MAYKVVRDLVRRDIMLLVPFESITADIWHLMMMQS